QPVLRGNWRKKIINRACTDRLQHGLAISRRFRQITHLDLLDVLQYRFDFSRAHPTNHEGHEVTQRKAVAPSSPSCTFVPLVVQELSRSKLNGLLRLPQTFRNRRPTAANSTRQDLSI